MLYPAAMRGLWALVALLSLTGTASALNQDEHAAVTMSACLGGGLPEAFCARVADEAYNTDHYEFADNTAHAIPYRGDRPCDTFNKVNKRLSDLARTASGAIITLRQTPDDASAQAQLAKALGRALHTIEDNCAHQGMPNEQHAWHSLSDTCEGTSNSPDVQPEAAECAWREARAVFGSVDRYFTALGADRSQLRPVRVVNKFPQRAEVCEFLGEWSQWDGVDRRWDNALVSGLITYNFDRSLRQLEFSPPDACTGPIDWRVKDPYPTVDVSTGLDVCKRVDAYCVGTGKADEGDEVPPWNTEDVEPSGGCSTGNGNAGLLLALGLLFVRRRSRGA